MSVDVLILNTAVVDIRSSEFTFVEKLVSPGGLAKCDTKDMPRYSQKQYREWIEHGDTSAGGPANSAPLITKAGISVSVGVNLGKGDYAGLDAAGQYFYDILDDNNVDLSAALIHPDLPTGITYIYDTISDDRGGLCYFPNANNDFDFDYYKEVVKRLKPKIVYCMYVEISARGDANGGKELAEFTKWCREQNCITLVDSVTLSNEPETYNLLLPVLTEVDIFFTSSDEAKLIAQTFGWTEMLVDNDEEHNNRLILNSFAEKFWQNKSRSRIFGITTSNGAFEKHIGQDDLHSEPCKVESRFMSKDDVDLVGAGDSFRAGVLSYFLRNKEKFKAKTLSIGERLSTW
jgi:sugar/nucleoside kinase (ribokinase family)